MAFALKHRAGDYFTIFRSDSEGTLKLIVDTLCEHNKEVDRRDFSVVPYDGSIVEANILDAMLDDTDDPDLADRLGIATDLAKMVDEQDYVSWFFDIGMRDATAHEYYTDGCSGGSLRIWNGPDRVILANIADETPCLGEVVTVYMGDGDGVEHCRQMCPRKSTNDDIFVICRITENYLSVVELVL